MTIESVVLLDAEGRAIGTAPKRDVHHASTPLHLAFSVYLFTTEGELLLTRRAGGKATFPGVWTNSACGHPGPGESMPAAIARRVASEVGISDIVGLRLVLPGFSYRAEMDGVVENEMCPVYAGWVHDEAVLSPDPHEVGKSAWVRWDRFAADVVDGRREVSAWCAEQVRELCSLGPDPAAWPVGDPAHLPPAARLADEP